MIKLNGYELSRNWFDFCFENPDKIKPNHIALYFFAIEHCNRLGWKNKFGFPSQMAMEAIGIKNWRTYNNTLTDLVEFGFIEMIEKSKNQYSSNIISLKSAYVKNTKALDKALQKHGTKRSPKQGQSTVSIDKQVTKNKEQLTSEFYKNQLSLANGCEIEYQKLIDLLFGKGNLETQLNGVLSIQDQITIPQFRQLLLLKNKTGKSMGDILTAIDNDKKYWKGKKSLYRTVRNWYNNTDKW